MTLPAAISPSRLETLVKPVDDALLGHDFEPTWADNDGGTRLATFQKGELKIEYVLQIKADAEKHPYAKSADVSLDVTLTDGTKKVVIYNSSSYSNTTTEAVIATLLRGDKDRESDWPNPATPSAHMAIIGLKGRLDEVLSQIPARYLVAASKYIPINGFTWMLWGAYDPGTVPFKLAVVGNQQNALSIATPDYDPDTEIGKVYLTVVDKGRYSPNLIDCQFEIQVSPKMRAPEGFDSHRLHSAVKETAKALA